VWRASKTQTKGLSANGPSVGLFCVSAGQRTLEQIKINRSRWHTHPITQFTHAHPSTSTTTTGRRRSTRRRLRNDLASGEHPPRPGESKHTQAPSYCSGPRQGKGSLTRGLRRQLPTHSQSGGAQRRIRAQSPVLGQAKVKSGQRHVGAASAG